MALYQLVHDNEVTLTYFHMWNEVTMTDFYLFFTQLARAARPTSSFSRLCTYWLNCWVLSAGMVEEARLSA